MNYWRIARFEIFQERDRLMNIELLMGKARESINKVSIGDIFVVKDLFEGYEWNELPKGDKLSFGRAFKDAVQSGRVSGVRYVGKRTNNSAEYIKE